MQRRQLIQSIFYSSLIPPYQSFFSRPKDQGFTDLQIEGQLPQDLRGTLYRVGPFIFSSSDGERYGHWFDGDGGVVAIQFNEGKAKGALQLIQTPYLSLEQKKQQRIYFGYDSPAPNAIFKFFTGNFKNVANTNIVSFPSETDIPELYALVESTLPTKINPDTLDYESEHHFDCIKGGFSAHPRSISDGYKEVLYNTGVQFGRKNRLSLYKFTTSKKERFILGEPHSPIIHDFVICDNYAIIIEPPLRLDIGDAIRNQGAFASSLHWEEKRGTRISIIDINNLNTSNKQNPKNSFMVPAFYQWHFANAFVDGEQIVVDLVYYPNFDSSTALAQIPLGTPNQGQLNGRLRRLIIHPKKEKFEWRDIAQHSGEFPQSHPKLTGKRHNYVYIAEHSSKEVSIKGLPDVISQYNYEQGIRSSVSIGDGTLVGEPILVPKRNAISIQDNSMEAKVWTIAQFVDLNKQKGGFAVLDGENFASGPIAKCYFDCPVPPTFHGTWIEGIL